MTGQPYKGHQGAISVVTYSHDGAFIASASVDHTVRIWDPTTGNLVYMFNGHSNSVSSVVFSPDGGQIISGGADGSIRKWDVKSGQSSGVIFQPYDKPAPDNADPGSNEPAHNQNEDPDPVSCICISPDGSRLIAGFGSKIRVIDIQTTEIITTLSMARRETVHWVGFSPDGTDILSVSKGKVTRQTTEKSSKGPPQHPNIVRVWRPGAHSDQQGSLDNASWSYENDGRVISPDGLLLWVPPDIVPHLKKWSVSPLNPFVLSPEGVVNLGYKDLCIGNRWAECYIQQD